MAIETFKRYEKKYMLTDEQYENVRKGIEKHMELDAYCINGKMYPVYNIYFDDDTSNVIRYSMSKPYFKDKLRIRSYKEFPKDHDFIFLELKKKIDGIVTKRRTELSLRDCKRYINTGDYPPEAETDYRLNQVLHEVDYFKQLYKVKPVIYLSYNRLAYFMVENKSFRVTFDKDILTRRHDLDFKLSNHGKELLQKNQTLMEIKIIGSIPMWCARLLSENGVFSRGFSKYGQEYKSYVTAENKTIDYSLEVV